MTRSAIPLLALLALLALTLGGPPPSGAAAPSGPVHSALVRVAGPSVAEALGRASDRAGAAGRPAAAEAPDALALARAEGAVVRAQAPVLAAAGRLGVRVVGRYAAALNGLLVHGDPGQLAALGRQPGVVSVEPAPLVWPAIARAAPYIGARALAAAKGYDGAGVVVAVIDTGLDYTHADFGGPGNPAAFDAANQAPDVITDGWEGAPLFPTAKVIGGYDFVGSRYTSPGFCSAADEQAGRCRSTPRPDPDPLDERSGNWADGHGTHVAGIVAGLGSGNVAPGVAPRALLVPLKVFGLPAGGVDVDTPSDVLVSAFDWCVRVNLGLPVAGTAPPRVDVINMSLGGWYDAGGQAYRTALAAARANGIVVVAAAGNDGDHAFIVNGPGTAPEALSVASAAASGDYDVTGQTPRWPGLISDFSGRGPGVNDTLKPDLTAPGAGIVSAAFGSGTGGRSSNGTSMATPMVSGTAALLVQRARAEGLGLDAQALAALMMNQASPGVAGSGDLPVPLARQGAGMLDAYRAGTAPFVATAGDTASLHLGALSLTGPLRLTRAIRARNLGAAPLSLRAAFTLRDPADEGKGLRVSLPEAPVALPAGASVDIPVTVDLDPAGLRPTPLGPGLSQIDETELEAAELDGWVTLTPVDEAGAEIRPSRAASLPFYVLPRRASAVTAAAAVTGTLRLVNPGPQDGSVQLLMLPDGAPLADPDEAEVAGPLDLRYVATAGGGGAGGGEAERVTFGLVLAAPLPVPQLTSVEIYLDADRDGRLDYRVRSGPASLFNVNDDPERMEVRVARWDAAAGAISGMEIPVGTPYWVDLYSRLAFVSVPAASVGLEQGGAYAFYVVHRGLNERWRPGLELDVAPDGADSPGGPRFVARPSPAVGSPTAQLVPAGGRLELDLADWPLLPAILALYRQNRFEPEGGQAQVIIPPHVDPPPRKVLLPWAGRR